MMHAVRGAYQDTQRHAREPAPATPNSSQPPHGVRQRTDSMSSIKTIRPPSKPLRREGSIVQGNDHLATSKLDVAQRAVAPPQRGRSERRNSTHARLPSPVVDRRAPRHTDAPTDTAPLSAERPVEFPTIMTAADAGLFDCDEDLEVVDMDLDSGSDSDDADPFVYDKDFVMVESSAVPWSLAAAKARITLLAQSLVPSFQEAWRESSPLFNKAWVPARFDVQLRSLEKYNVFWDVQTPSMQVRGEVVVEDRLLMGSTTQMYSAPPVKGLTIFFWPAAWDNCAPGSSLSARAQKSEYIRSSWRGCPVFSDHLIRADGRAIRVDSVCVQGPWKYVPDNRTPGGVVCHPAFTLPFVLDVPKDLFDHVDFRLIRLRVAVAFECTDDGGRVRSLDTESPVVDFAVEHLRKERHMDGSKLLHPSF